MREASLAKNLRNAEIARSCFWLRKEKTRRRRRVFSLNVTDYRWGSTLSNTRFANNELSSINC